MEKIILHIDFDSFFASVEQQNNPLLRNKPLGVTATNGRTCIIASSREAKKLGIKTASRTYEALEICPTLNLVSANFVEYFEISKKFLSICQNFSPDVELFSIDEVFVDITLTNHLFGGPYKMIQKLKKEIKEKIGEYITVSIGISYNKLLAKLASGINKPDGMFEITKNNLELVYAKSKLTDICGIGNRIKARLNKIGIYNLVQLRKSPIDILKQEFGSAESEFLKNVGLGLDSNSLSSFASSPDIKSVGRNYCLPKNTYDKKIVLQNIYELCEEVGIKLRRLSMKARTIGIYLRGSEIFHGRKTFQFYFDRGSEIFHLCMSRLILNTRINLGNNKTYVRQIGIWVGNLKETKDISLTLFTSEKENRLQKTIDEINERFGDHTIRNGFLLHADKLTTVPNGWMADKYERTKLALKSV